MVSPSRYIVQQQLQKDHRQPQGQQKRHRQQLIENNRKRILIVDDYKPDNNSTLRLELERNGFIVDTFTDPLLALNHFSSGIYDMVVLDKKMSKVNAIDLHKQFKKIDNKIRICILGPAEAY